MVHSIPHSNRSIPHSVLSFFAFQHLDEELTLATEAFFESESLTVDQERGEVRERERGREEGGYLHACNF